MGRRMNVTATPGRTRRYAAGLAAGFALFLSLFPAQGARAEATVPVTGASPLPPNVELRFCYYAGLAYSVGSVITIDVPNRREVVTDRPRKAFRCIQGDDTEQGRHFWQELDPDAGDPFRD